MNHISVEFDRTVCVWPIGRSTKNFCPVERGERVRDSVSNVEHQTLSSVEFGHTPSHSCLGYQSLSGHNPSHRHLCEQQLLQSGMIETEIDGSPRKSYNLRSGTVFEINVTASPASFHDMESNM